MISVAEARQLIEEHCNSFGEETTSLYNALGHFCAEDIFSPIDMPSYDQSAMDGYALRYEDYQKNIPLYNEGEIAAGVGLVSAVDPEHCIQIFTGALVPPGVDTIVIQERVTVEGKHIVIQDENLMRGANIRKRGSQSKQGELVLRKGSPLTPSACSLLAGFGLERVKVYKKPSVDVLVTGNELIRPPEQMKDGKVFESNSFALKNALTEVQIADVRIRKAADLEYDIHQKIGDGLKADILIITGGVSVGKYDLVQQALADNGVTQILHRVKQKPGKPFYFGKKGNTLVFGLPGNPGSVMTCFYTYVLPAIQTALGSMGAFNSTLRLSLKNELTKKAGLTTFYKGKISGPEVEILDHQESYKMNAFAVADALVEVEAEVEHLTKGSTVIVHLI